MITVALLMLYFVLYDVDEPVVVVIPVVVVVHVNVVVIPVVVVVPSVVIPVLLYLLLLLEPFPTAQSKFLLEKTEETEIGGLLHRLDLSSCREMIYFHLLCYHILMI